MCIACYIVFQKMTQIFLPFHKRLFSAKKKGFFEQNALFLYNAYFLYSTLNKKRSVGPHSMLAKIICEYFLLSV